MSASPYAYQHYLLQSLTTQFGLADTKSLALQPGTQAVYRVTCHYPDKLPLNSVATLVHSLTDSPTLSIRHEDTPEEKVQRDYDPDALAALKAAFASLKFDRMDDQPGIPSSGETLWLVERAASGFHKAILLAPGLAEDKHHDLVFRLHEFMPKAVEPVGYTNHGAD